MAIFPSADWVQALKEKLNNDERYGQIAHKWEGDMRFVLEPDGALTETLWIYIDLWHGKCRDAYMEPLNSRNKPAFILKAPYRNFVQVITGKIEPMAALLSRKLSVQGNMVLLMRNVPTVLDFVRCCQEVTDSTL